MVVKINFYGGKDRFQEDMLFCGQPPTPWSHHWSGHLWCQGCTCV